LNYKRLFIIILFIIPDLYAKDLHDWQTITYMNDITDMIYFKNEIWVSTTGGAYRFSPEDSSYANYTNIDGLGALDLTAVEKDKYDHLLFASRDGTINRYDVTSDAWAVYRDLNGEEIVDLYALMDTLWVATNKGVAVYLISADNLEFRDFYNNLPLVPEKAYRLTIFNHRLYYATEKGLLYAPSDFLLNNLKISEAWQLITVNNGLPANIIYDLVPTSDSLLIATYGGVASIDREGDLSELSDWGSGLVSKILISGEEKVFIRDKDYFRKSTGIWMNFGAEDKLITSGVIDEDNELWIGLKAGGIKKRTWTHPFLIDGPASNFIGVLVKDRNGKLWISSGKFKLSHNYGFYNYDFQNWTNYLFYDNDWNRKNAMAYVYEDMTGKIWFGAWGGGIAVIDDRSLDFYHSWSGDGRMTISTVDGIEEFALSEVPQEKRSCLTGADILAENYTVIPFFKEDEAGHLWCVNHLARDRRYLAVLPRDLQGNLNMDCNNWAYFGNNIGILSNESEISSLEFDDFGRLWIGSYTSGILVFDYNRTIENLGDDKPLTKYTATNASLFSNVVLCLKRDLDGIIWIGTAGGLNSYDGVNFYKHVGEIGPVENKINQIFVDDFNNKWFATDGGMSILQSNQSPWDPSSWVHYTPENSGLPSKIVNSIFVDHQVGEAYIGTESGLSVFSGPFSDYKQDFSTVTAGPSPFILNDDTPYIIKNLVFGASVKILDINGRLIQLLTQENGGVEGGRAAWDGRNLSNALVSSGIYIYLIYNDEGISGHGKIAVIRP
jgi:ligand-binding sensor domain-containing protein